MFNTKIWQCLVIDCLIFRSWFWNFLLFLSILRWRFPYWTSFLLANHGERVETETRLWKIHIIGYIKWSSIKSDSFSRPFCPKSLPSPPWEFPCANAAFSEKLMISPLSCGLLRLGVCYCSSRKLWYRFCGHKILAVPVLYWILRSKEHFLDKACSCKVNEKERKEA